MSKKEYTIGETYEGLGKYLGIQKYFPWNVDYYELRHKFASKLPTDGRSAADIKTVLIEKIKR